MITEDKLKELFDNCQGRRSHFLILTQENPELIQELVKEGYITFLKNGEKKPWYSATNKLITKFRDLDKLELRQLELVNEELAAEKIEMEQALLKKEKIEL